MTEYRWNIKGYIPDKDAAKCIFKDMAIDSEKNLAQLIEQILNEEGEDFIIEYMELTHRIEIKV